MKIYIYKLINSFKSVCFCRYIRNLPNSQNFGLTQFHVHNFQPPYLQYETVLPQLGQMPNTQASPSYCYSSLVLSPYDASMLYQSSMDAVYVQVPSPAMMYAQSYDQLRHAVFQVVVLSLYTLHTPIYTGLQRNSLSFALESI